MMSQPQPETRHALSSLPKKVSPRKAHRAGWVLIEPSIIVQNGYVVIENETIQSVGQGRPPGDFPVIDHGPGVLMPPLANVHTHLEVSALKGKVDQSRGFRMWVRDLIRLRDEIDSETLRESARDAIRSLLASGCALAGEISTVGLTRDLFSDSPIYGVWFREFLGGTDHVPPMALSVESDSYNTRSLAGHGPHTTSPQLLTALKKETRMKHLPFSIHVAESEDEMEFLANGKGAWADFLTERGIDFRDWPIGSISPIQYLEKIGILDHDTIAVHLIEADAEDLALLRKRKVSVCLCPRSNRTLHHRLPDIETLCRKGVNLCLGTDSLASVDSLSMFDEMAFVAEMFPNLSPPVILQMATSNGSDALGLSNHFGTLAPGKQGVMVYVPLHAATREQLLCAIVNARCEGNSHLIGFDDGF